MMKLAGSLLVFLSCVMLGMNKSRELRIHVKELEEFKRIFLLIRGELQYSRSAFSEIFAAVSQKTEGIYRTWLSELSENLERREQGSFEETWEKSLQIVFQRSLMTKEEQVDLLRIGKSLNYLETLELYLIQLEQSIEYRREEEKNKRKLYQSMGILGGIFLVIVLV